MSVLFMVLQTQTAEHKMAALAAVLSRNIQTLTRRQVDEESTENTAMNLIFIFVFLYFFWYSILICRACETWASSSLAVALRPQRS